MAYESKQSELAARQLSAQEISVTVNAVAGSSDLPSSVVVSNSTLSATVITLKVSEIVKKCLSVKVINRATGAVVALAAAPSLAVAEEISVTVDGTAQTDLAVEFKYIVA